MFSNAQYINDNIIRVDINGVTSYVGASMENADYAALIASGEPIAPYVPPAPPVPQSVTPRQVRLLLLQQGLLANVEAIIAASDKPTQITWQYASEFRRDDPLLEALSQQLGLTSEQVDGFFIAAAAI